MIRSGVCVCVCVKEPLGDWNSCGGAELSVELSAHFNHPLKHPLQWSLLSVKYFSAVYEGYKQKQRTHIYTHTH